MITRKDSVVRDEAKLIVGKEEGGGGGEKVVSTPWGGRASVVVEVSEAIGTLTVPFVVATVDIVEVEAEVKGVIWLKSEENGLFEAAADTAAAIAEADSSHP